MKITIIKAALIVATISAITGCSSLDEERDSKIQSLITFTPMEIQSITRGTQTTKNAITSYGVTSSIYSAGSSYTSAKCGSYWLNEEIETVSGNSGHYWPGGEYRVSFFTYAPYGSPLSIRSSNDLGYPVYQYSVPSAISNQIDFITADIIDHSGEGITDPIPLTFSHQCTDIRFNIYNQGTESLTVHSIAICGVKYSGTCAGGVWTLNDAVNSTSVNPFLLTLGTAVSGGATVDVTGTNNHFIMLPQIVPSGTNIFDIDATIAGTRKHYYYTLTSNLTLLKSKTYTFNITLGESGIIVDMETDIQDWEVETKYLNIGSIGSNSTWTQTSVQDAEDFGISNWEEE